MITSAQAIIFDLDGTLLDTISDIASCANTVLCRSKYPQHDVTTYKELVGDGLGNLARKVLPAAHRSEPDITRFIDEYRELYKTTWNQTTTIYPGVSELIKELTQREIRLAVLSNKRHDFSQLCVDTYFPENPFTEVRGEQQGVPIKPDPTAALSIAACLGVDPTRCIFVGDSEIDIETANRASMPSIGVLWGFRTQTILEAAGASLLVSDPTQILQALGNS